jgi:hypothetical protein
MRISIVGARCLEQRALMRGRGAEGLGDGGSTAEVHDLFSLATLNMSSVGAPTLIYGRRSVAAERGPPGRDAPQSTRREPMCDSGPVVQIHVW